MTQQLKRSVLRRHAISTVVAFALLGLPMMASAGPELSVRQQVKAASSVIVVQVNLRGRASVVTKESLFGAKVRGKASWLGMCLPDRALLKRWSRRSSQDRDVQRRAHASGRYSAVVFLSSQGKPICGVEASRLHHTSASSAFGLFKEATTLAIRTYLHDAPGGRPAPSTPSTGSEAPAKRPLKK